MEEADYHILYLHPYEFDFATLGDKAFQHGRHPEKQVCSGVIFAAQQQRMPCSLHVNTGLGIPNASTIWHIVLKSLLRSGLWAFLPRDLRCNQLLLCMVRVLCALLSTSKMHPRPHAAFIMADAFGAAVCFMYNTSEGVVLAIDYHAIPASTFRMEVHISCCDRWRDPWSIEGFN